MYEWMARLDWFHGELCLVTPLLVLSVVTISTLFIGWCKPKLWV